MNEEGYTLIEVLVALMVIGLAMTAMTAAVNAIGRLQRTGAADAISLERAQAFSNGLDIVLAGQGPFASAGSLPMAGDAQGFSFACGRAQSCRARLAPEAGGESLTFQGAGGVRRLAWRGKAKLAFRYVGAKTTGDHWPPDNPTDWQPLRLIILGRAGPDFQPLAYSRLWIEGAPGEMATPGGRP